MTLLHIQRLSIPDVILLTPRQFEDSRGSFSETWNRARMGSAGIDLDFVQDNQSLSSNSQTVRGLHFQAPPHAQAKLVRCVVGKIFDVAVDIRRGSPTFGKWVGVELTPENGAQLLVPVGFAHGFATRLADSVVAYKCTDYYAPDCEGSIRFDDPALGIDWGIDNATAHLSEKDAEAPSFSELESPFDYGD